MAENQQYPFFPMQRTVNINDGTAQRWQVDPKDIRLFVEENLRGIRTTEFKEFTIIFKGNNIANVWADNEEKAKEEMFNYCKEKNIFSTDCHLEPTGNTQKVQVQVTEPLVNEIGAYHLLSIVEGVFSRIGYMSNIDDNEINDIMYDDVLQNLIISLMQNHEKYGVKTGSRDEIIGFITSTCMLILKSSRKGWSGNRFAGSVQEQIVTQPEKKKVFGLIG